MNGINGIGHHFAAADFINYAICTRKHVFHLTIVASRSAALLARVAASCERIALSFCLCETEHSIRHSALTLLRTHTPDEKREKERASESRPPLSHPTSYFVHSQPTNNQIPNQMLFDGRPYGVLFVNTIHGYV